MSDKSRLCVECGCFIAGNVVQTDDGPVHDCAELQARLSASIDVAKLKDQILKDAGVEWWMIEDGVRFVDQARLSATERENAELRRAYESDDEATAQAAEVVKLREANERLKELVERRSSVREIADLQARLSAAEGELAECVSGSFRLMAERDRAEEVVGAVKEAQRDWLPDDDPISIAVRRYEEKK